MSTKLYNGYRFTEPMTLRDIHAFCLQLRDRLQPIADLKSKQHTAKLAVGVIDRYAMKQRPLRLVKGAAGSSIFHSNRIIPVLWASRVIDDMLKEDVYRPFPRRCQYDLSCNIAFIPVGRQVLFLWYPSDVKEYTEILNSYQNVEEFVYYDNTDRPEHLTARQWAARRRLWERAFEVNGSASWTAGEVSLQFDLVDNLRTQIASFGFGNEVASYAPTFAQRVRGPAKNRVLNDKMKELQAQRDASETAEGDKASRRSDVGLVFDALDWLKTSDGKAAVAAAEDEIRPLLKKVLTREDFSAEIPAEIVDPATETQHDDLHE